MIWLIIFAVLAVIIAVHLYKTKKEPRLSDVSLVTGGVKTGKSSMSLFLAYRRYCKSLRNWRIKCYFISKLRKGKPYPEKPLFYSNIPVAFPHIPLTRELILRKHRFAYKSVAFVDEASLLADAFDWKDMKVNEQVKLFNKLWGHETHGGFLIYNTQNPQDLHYNIRRCLNTYLWIHHCIKWIPFLLVFQVREMYCADEHSANNFNEDVEETLKWVVCSKRIWKKFDCYCYSHYTDDATVDRGVITADTMKADLLTFKVSTELQKQKGALQ